MDVLPNSAELRLAEAIRLVGWRGFETALANLFQSAVAPDNLIVLAFGDAGSPAVLYQRSDNPHVFARLSDTYVAGAFRLDPFHDLHLRRAPAGVYWLRDIAPDAFQRSRYYSEYYEQTTLIDEITFIAYPSDRISLHLCLGRDISTGRMFSAEDRRTCRRIAPIVQALAARHWAGLPAAEDPAEDIAALLARAVSDAHAIHLSPRQAEVALLILQGHSSGSIGLRLGISAQTVKVFRKQLYSRCGISSQAELFAMMLPLLKGAGTFKRGAAR